MWAARRTHHATHSAHAAIISVRLHLVHQHAGPSLDNRPPVEGEEAEDQDETTVDQGPSNDDACLDLIAVLGDLLLALLVVTLRVVLLVVGLALGVSGLSLRLDVLTLVVIGLTLGVDALTLSEVGLALSLDVLALIY